MFKILRTLVCGLAITILALGTIKYPGSAIAESFKSEGESQTISADCGTPIWQSDPELGLRQDLSCFISPYEAADLANTLEIEDEIIDINAGVACDMESYCCSADDAKKNAEIDKLTKSIADLDKKIADQDKAVKAAQAALDAFIAADADAKDYLEQLAELEKLKEVRAEAAKKKDHPAWVEANKAVIAQNKIVEAAKAKLGAPKQRKLMGLQADVVREAKKLANLQADKAAKQAKLDALAGMQPCPPDESEYYTADAY